MQIMNYLSFDKFLIFTKNIHYLLYKYLLDQCKMKTKKNQIMTFEDHTLKKSNLNMSV